MGWGKTMRKLRRARLLVTGGAGFMGSSFIRTLLSQEEFEGQIVNLDLLTYCGSLLNLENISGDSRYNFVLGDISDTKLVDELISDYHIDTVVHFAAESHVDRSIESAGPFFKTNVLGTLNLLEVIKNRQHIHFHHISTDEVYGDTSIEEPFTENSQYRPNSPYAASKAASDHIVRSFCQTYHVSACITHSVNNYGPFQFPEKLIPVVLEKLMNKKPIPIYGSGLQIRDWLYVEDHSRAIIAALEHSRPGFTYNLSAKNPKTNLDLVHNLIDVFAKLKGEDQASYKTLISHVQDRLGHDMCYVVNPEFSYTSLNWKPRVDFDEGLKQTVSWYLQNSSWIQSVLDRGNQSATSLECVGAKQ